ncbi:hypothetical protein. Putative prophage protein [Tenacibaculum dicentrarchi]|nr:hypothetical protein. Putative prophage protein [Tenacibaculum dicentrarchi]
MEQREFLGTAKKSTRLNNNFVGSSKSKTVVNIDKITAQATALLDEVSQNGTPKFETFVKKYHLIIKPPHVNPQRENQTINLLGRIYKAKIKLDKIINKQIKKLNE